MSFPVIAMIGAGHMGSSLIGGLIANGHPADKIWAADLHQENLSPLKETFHIHITTNNVEATNAADVIIFAVKPQVFAEVAAGLRDTIHHHKPLIISIAAGIREASIQHWLGGNRAIVRCMPNTPAMIGCGATALYANTHVTAHQRSMAESILRAVGITVWVDDETLMDTVTALSGSGPAYFFLVMEALQTGAEELGLSHDVARLLTLQTALGAARMALESGTPLDELRQHVTSPGGTTEKAISVLEECNIRAIFKKALAGAKERGHELSQLLGDKK